MLMPAPPTPIMAQRPGDDRFWSAESSYSSSGSGASDAGAGYRGFDASEGLRLNPPPLQKGTGLGGGGASGSADAGPDGRWSPDRMGR